MTSTHEFDGGWPAERWQAALADSDRLWEEVEQELLEGQGLKAIARGRGFPVLRFLAWVADDEVRSVAYGRILKLRADELAHEALEVAKTPMDGVTVTEKEGGKFGDVTETVHADMLGHRKLLVETNLRLASKWDRATYGDSVRVEQAVEVTLSLNFGRQGEVPIDLPAIEATE